MYSVFKSLKVELMCNDDQDHYSFNSILENVISWQIHITINGMNQRWIVYKSAHHYSCLMDIFKYLESWKGDQREYTTIFASNIHWESEQDWMYSDTHSILKIFENLY